MSARDDEQRDAHQLEAEANDRWSKVPAEALEDAHAEQEAAAAILDAAERKRGETPPDAEEPADEGKPKRRQGRKAAGSQKASSGRPRGRGRGRAQAAVPSAEKPAREPSETELLAALANGILTAKGPVSQTLSANEVDYVRQALGGPKAKGEVVKLLGFKSEKALRSFVEGVGTAEDKAKLRDFVKAVKAVHPSPRIRPRKVAAAALAIADRK